MLLPLKRGLVLLSGLLGRLNWSTDKIPSWHRVGIGYFYRVPYYFSDKRASLWLCKTIL